MSIAAARAIPHFPGPDLSAHGASVVPHCRAAAATVAPHRAPLGPASVSGFDGQIIATVSRQWEQTPTESTRSLMVVEITGDIDLDTIAMVNAVLMDALDSLSPVCCDLARVTFFSAAGANMLRAAHRYAAQSGGNLCVRGAHGITRQVLEITSLDLVLTMQD